MDKKKKITLIILLFLMLAALLYYFKFFKKIAPINFTEQGSSTLKEGKIQLQIWDNNTEDGDTVKVYLDDQLMRDTLPLRYEPLDLALGRLSKGEHILGVVAISEGSTSPASASMNLSNGTEKKVFEMNATIKKPASWKIIIK
jgi:hypothetical protein